MTFRESVIVAALGVVYIGVAFAGALLVAVYAT